MSLISVMTWQRIQDTTKVDDANRTYQRVPLYVVQVRVPHWVAVLLQRCGVRMWTS